MIRFPDDAWFQVKSADKPASLRGEGLDLVVVDEVAHIKKFNEVWEQSLRPALSDRQGGALFISTPGGFNHFWELYKNADEMDGWASFQYPTWTNPYISESEIDEARKQLPQLVFRQEYGAEFVQLAGAILKRDWFRVVDSAPDGIRWVRFWDLAASIKAMADFTVGAKVGLHNGSIYIGDIVRGRWEWPDARRVICDTAKLDGATVQIGVEEVAFQLAAVQELRREPSLVAHHVRGIKPDRDKLARAMPWISRAEQGLVHLIKGAWARHFLDEACAFPESEHDDQVDAVSGAVQMLGRRVAPKIRGI